MPSFRYSLNQIRRMIWGTRLFYTQLEGQLQKVIGAVTTFILVVKETLFSCNMITSSKTKTHPPPIVASLCYQSVP